MHNDLHSFILKLQVKQVITADACSPYEVEAISWEKVAQLAAAAHLRFVGLWAQDLGEMLQNNVCFEFGGEYLFLRVKVPVGNPKIASFTPYFSAANRLERHAHDMFGIKFIDHPDHHRWTRHQAWDENQFPLRKNFVSSVKTKTPPDNTYPFMQADGPGVYEIPVGPVHAGIIEPGHFRFQAAGEDVINLEERFGYVHKGIEKIAEGRSVAGLMKLAGRVSGDSTVAYAWATAKACENSLNIMVPERAAFIRGILCERERVANHLGDFAAICNDVAYALAYYQLMRLKEDWLRINSQVFGHRLLMDQIIVGGVARDLNAENCQLQLEQIKSLRAELVELYPIFDGSSTLHDRLKTTGILTTEDARKFGVTGYVGKASGLKFDLRHDAPYAPYTQLNIKVPVYNTGDVLARTRVRAQEILISLDLLEQMIAKLPDGSIGVVWEKLGRPAEGIGLIDGWRGEIFVYVGLNSDGLVERFFPRDPSWFSWPALEKLIHGNIVPDFPVCNKSVNGSYSGVDL